MGSSGLGGNGLGYCKVLLPCSRSVSILVLPIKYLCSRFEIKSRLDFEEQVALPLSSQQFTIISVGFRLGIEYRLVLSGEYRSTNLLGRAA